MSQSRQFRDDAGSYKKTGIPRGDIKRFGSRDVLRMGGDYDPAANPEPVETEARKQLRELAKRQGDVDITLPGTLSKKKQFVGSSLHQPMKEDLHGQVSFEEYRDVAIKDEQLEYLRMCGLTDEEIDIKINHEKKKSQMGSHSYGANPDIIEQRLAEINQKIQGKEEFLQRQDKFKPLKKLTRHEMDLEKSLKPNDPLSSKIGHLLVTSAGEASTSDDQNRDDADNPIKKLLKEISEKDTTASDKEKITEEVPKVKCVKCQQLDILVKYGHRRKAKVPEDCIQCQIALSKSEKEANPDRNCDNSPAEIQPSVPKEFLDKVSNIISKPKAKAGMENDSGCVIGPLRKGKLGPWTKHEDIERVPQHIVERFRLTLDEIKMIPMFANYTMGEPSKTLFVKNLSTKVSECDLVSIFGRYEDRGSVNYRLLTGRMKGQAFITFTDEATATEALKLVNGYMFKDKPIIIQYGKKS